MKYHGKNQSSTLSPAAVFTLAMISSTGFLRIHHTQELKKAMRVCAESILCNSLVERVCGEWRFVWGPALFNHKVTGRGTADNSAFMAVSGDHPGILFISLAGTNPISEYAWKEEDFAVGNTVPWPVKGQVREDLRLAEGAFRGLTHTLSLEDQERKFLNALSFQVHRFSINQIIIAGHSLGGALATVVGAWLQDNIDLWSSRKIPMEIWSFAGPSVGTPAWSHRMEKVINKKKCRYYRIWNRNDIVPYSWNKEDLNQIPDLYGPDIPSGMVVRSLVRWASVQKNGNEYIHINRDAPGFALSTEDIDDLQIISRDRTSVTGFRLKEVALATKFINRMVYEHIPAYFIYYDLKDVLKVMISHSIFTKSYITHMIAGFRFLGRSFRFDLDYTTRFLCRMQGSRND